MASLQKKRSVEDIYPMKGKKVLVRVDFNVPIKDGIINNDLRIRAALPTIRKILSQGGSAILMSHLGRPSGAVSYNKFQGDLNYRRTFLETWVAEHGTGKTSYFAAVSGAEKKAILSWSSKAKEAESMSEEKGSGKTLLFSQLPNQEKKDLLDRLKAKRMENVLFPQLDKHKYSGYDYQKSLKPVAVRLQQLLVESDPHCLPVLFAEDCLEADRYVRDLKPGQALLLENVRFYKDESSKNEDDRLKMATKIASYGDIYVSDAFGTAHRDSATMTGIPQVMGNGSAGYLMAKEINAFRQVTTDPPHPFCAIVGGAKVSDKILLLENLMNNVNCLVIGGAMAYTFLKANGHDIGKSFSQAGQTFKDKKTGEEMDIVELAKQLLDKAKEKGIDVYLPIDHVCHTECAATDDPVVTDDANVPPDLMALDIGPKTIELYKEKIGACKAVIWNGPMGVFEIDTYSKGTFGIAAVMADMTEKTGAITIIGGGDSASAAEKSGNAARMTHVSTGGGASLELLEGKKLPGIAVLDDSE